MKTPVRLVAVSLLAGAFFAGLVVPQLAASAPAAEPAAKPTLVLNVTAGRDDLHSATMAMQLAGHALDDGRAVVIFLNVRAPEFASSRAAAAPPSRFAFQDNPPLPLMLRKLIDRGAQVLVCPQCAAALDVTPDELAEGIQLADREKLFSRLGPQTHVFTY